MNGGGDFSDEGLAVCVLFCSFVLSGCYAVELFTPLFSRSAVRESIFGTLSARRCVEVPASVADHKTPPMGSHHTITQLKFILDTVPKTCVSSKVLIFVVK